MRKKVFLMATAIACMFGFASCDDLNIEKLTEADVIGHINIYASNPTNTDKGDQYYANGDSTNFKSALCNVNFTYEDEISIDAGSVFVGTENNLLTSTDGVEITLPLIGINLRDTVPGSYEVNCPVNQISFFEHLDTVNWMSLITTNNSELGNVVVIPTSESAMYIAYNGTIDIEQFQQMGSLVKGTINNVHAVYVTLDDVEALMALDETVRKQIDLINNFPQITLNGVISCRRANIGEIITALDEMQ